MTNVGVSFSVIFFDGEQESNLCDVVISPSSNLKSLQSILSQKIGISPHQFSIYLVDRNRRGSRIPVTNKNFSAVSREKECFFLVVLKRSRRERRPKSHNHELVTEMASQNRFNPPANVTLLRRDGNHSGMNVDAFSDLDACRFGYERRLMEFHMEKEKYLMNMGFGLSLGSSLGIEGLILGNQRVDTDVVCEECLTAKQEGREVNFHWCVNDAVTVGRFQSPAGPIARPVKGRK